VKRYSVLGVLLAVAVACVAQEPRPEVPSAPSLGLTGECCKLKGV
jgi:hypothetical protein